MRDMPGTSRSAPERNGHLVSAVLLGLVFRTSYTIFLHMWKTAFDGLVYLIRGTSKSPQEHPFFISVKLDL